MRLEDRLSNHLRSRGENLTVPDTGLDAVTAAVSIRAKGLRLFFGVAGIAVLAAAGFGALYLVGGQLLPGGIRPLGDTFGDDADPARVVVSPYLEVENTLGEPDRPLFSITADRPSYWRLATLETYEDDIWKTSGDYDEFDGPLPGASVLDGEQPTLLHVVEVRDLNSIWLPVAPEPYEVIERDAELTWNDEADSLTVANNLANSNGLTYTAVSTTPAWTSDELRAAQGTDPEEIVDRYLSPGGGTYVLSPMAREIAATVTQGSPTRFDQSLAIQDYFRSFAYDENPPQLEIADPVERLLVSGRGFAPQLAGAFALMAREVGIPARVAVGFTWGEPEAIEQPGGPTTYTITGRHSHAWPEVYFDGIGWVPFEPTPGRGLPGAVQYTGVEAAQASSIADG